MVTEQARDDLAEQMLPVAANLAMLVHGDGGPQDVAAVLAALGEQERTALIVVLAGLVDPDQPMGHLLGWLQVGTGRAVRSEPSREERMSLRQIAEEDEAAAHAEALDEDFIDESAVLAYLAGRRVEVTPRERYEAVSRGRAMGMQYAEFDQMHGLLRCATQDWMLRVQRRVEKYGEPFPNLLPNWRRDFGEQEIVRIRTMADEGKSLSSIGREFHLSRHAVSRIVHGQTYADMGGPIRELPQDAKPGSEMVKGAGRAAVAA